MPGHQTLTRLTIVLLVIATLAGSRDVIAAGPDLRLRPDEGAPGASILARGRDFSPGAEGAITWGDDPAVLATFTADDDGDFEATISAPDVPPGDYDVVATSGNIATDDPFRVEPSPTEAPTAAPPPVMASPAPSTPICTGAATREVDVASAAELETALAEATAGGRIAIAPGTYTGNFVVEASGTEEQRIELCAAEGAAIDGGGWEHSGYALHITGDSITVQGLEVGNAQEGVMLDGASRAVLSELDVHTIGHEAVHFRTHSTDNVIRNSAIHDTGLDNEKFGEGIYIGSAVSNWERYTDGEPDRSDRNQVLSTTIWNTSSESIDIKEGTEGGLVQGNVFDGSGLSGADSWMDVKGNGYVIRGNTGANSPEDGFQTHVIDNMEWGRGNVFEQNVATVNGSGYGFYIHQPDQTGNTVRCDNIVEDAASGFTNLPEGCAG